MDDRRYSTKRWRLLRLAVLNRDGWCCTIPHPHCKYKAEGSLATAGKRKAHVHHLNPPVEGGDFWDIENLVSVCATYNIAERNQRWNKTITGTTPSPSRQW